MFEQPKRPSVHLGKPLPSDLEEIIMQCLAKNPESRPSSTSELLTALMGCEDAHRYDRAAALAWWRVRRARVVGEQARVLTPSNATMAVDLRGRNDLAAPATT
jgi:serine/threonine protein kinase